MFKDKLAAYNTSRKVLTHQMNSYIHICHEPILNFQDFSLYSQTLSVFSMLIQRFYN